MTITEFFNETEPNQILYAHPCNPRNMFGYEDSEQYETLRKKIELHIDCAYTSIQIRYVITDGTQGFSQLVFDAVEKVKKKTGPLYNILILPCTEIQKNWHKEGIFGTDHFEWMLKRADRVIYESIKEPRTKNRMLGPLKVSERCYHHMGFWNATENHLDLQKINASKRHFPKRSCKEVPLADMFEHARIHDTIVYDHELILYDAKEKHPFRFIPLSMYV